MKTAVFDTRNPKSPYRGRGAIPHPTPTPRSVAMLPRRSVNSLPRLPLFPNISCLIPAKPHVNRLYLKLNESEWFLQMIYKVLLYFASLRCCS